MEEVAALLGLIRHAKRAACAAFGEPVALLPVVRCSEEGQVWANLTCVDEPRVFAPGSAVLQLVGRLAMFGLIDEVALSIDAVATDRSRGALVVLRSTADVPALEGASLRYEWTEDGSPTFSQGSRGAVAPGRISEALTWAWAWRVSPDAERLPFAGRGAAQTARRRAMALDDVLSCGLILTAEDTTGATVALAPSPN